MAYWILSFCILLFVPTPHHQSLSIYHRLHVFLQLGYIDQLGTDGDPVTVYVNAGELDGVTLGGEALVTATNIDINSGSIDACTVGANTPLAGTFTTLTANGNVTLGDGVGDVTTVTGQLTASNGLKVDASNLLVDEKVGIGTTSPSSNLEIEGSSGDLIFEIDNNASNSANFQIQNGAVNARVDLVMNDG